MNKYNPDIVGDPSAFNYNSPLVTPQFGSFVESPLLQMVVVLKELKESLDSLNETLKQAAVKPPIPTHQARPNGREY